MERRRNEGGTNKVPVFGDKIYMIEKVYPIGESKNNGKQRDVKWMVINLNIVIIYADWKPLYR
jgi:hypothetical protein